MAENKMGTMYVRPLLLSMAGPAILSMIANALYNIIDSMFVAQIGEEAFTAISIVAPVQMLSIAVSAGSGIGVNSYISRMLGSKKQNLADQAACTSVFMGIFNYLIFLIIGMCFTEEFIGKYADEGTVIYEQAKNYMQIVCIGSLFTHVEIMLERMLQGTGNMRAPMFCCTIGVFINLILDPILIFGYFGIPAYGASGAAIATVISQIISLSFSVYFIRRQNVVNVNLRKFHPNWGIIRDIYSVAVPSIALQSVTSFMLIFMNMMLAVHSATAVAVLGAFYKINSFIDMPAVGINQGAMPIIGYNYGARDKERVMSAYKFALILAYGVMFCGLLLLQIAPGFLLGLFYASSEMYEMGIPAFRIMSVCYVAAGFGMITSAMFQATRHGFLSLAGSFLRRIGCILPLTWILLKTNGLKLVWAAIPLAEIIGTIYFAVTLRWLYKKKLQVSQRNKFMKHIFFTGPRGVGKSTRLQQCVRDSGLKASGIITLRFTNVMEIDSSVHMLPASKTGVADPEKFPDEENRLFYCAQKEPTPEIGQRFDVIGCRLLETMPKDTQLIVLDEIGPAEAFAPAFQAAVMKLLDGDIPVIGVLQAEKNSFAEKIKSHPQVQVLEVTPWWE